MQMTLQVQAVCQERAESPLNCYQRSPSLEYLCQRARSQLSKWYYGSGL